MTPHAILSHLKTGGDHSWDSARGGHCATMFHDGDRYMFDFDMEGTWMQFDTSQDAWYFGCWVNKNERLILSYCEGDITLTTCDTDEIFNAEIEHMCDFYDEGFVAKVIDENGMTGYRQERKEFFI